MYHETTFTDGDRDKAEKTFHSTTLQAAAMASKAKVKKLVIGHFSARYDDASELVNEAKSIFEATEAANEGARFTF